MTGKYDQLIFLTFMTLVTGLVGGVVMVVAWAKVLGNPTPAMSNARAVVAFTASVVVGAVGAIVTPILPRHLMYPVWTLVLVISFALVVISLLAARKDQGLGSREVKVGAIILFLVDLIGLIGVFMAIPGMPLNR